MNLNNEVSPGERVTDENCQRHIRVKAETIENDAPSRERALLFPVVTKSATLQKRQFTKTPNSYLPLILLSQQR